MSKEIQISVPSTLSVGDYVKFGSLEHLSDTEKVIRIVSVLADITEDEVRTFSLSDVSKIYKDFNERLEEIQPIFIPIFEWGNQLWGFQPLHKMKVSEYVDLEKRLTNGIESMSEILSILYRPVTKSSLDGVEWKIKHNLKYVLGKSENLFKYYDIEDYDIEKREFRKKQMDTLPISVALGAYNFFLSTGQMLLKDLATSFRKEMMEMTKEEKEEFNRLANSMGGSTHFMDLLKKVESLD